MNMRESIYHCSAFSVPQYLLTELNKLIVINKVTLLSIYPKNMFGRRKNRDYLKDLGVDGKIILERILRVGGCGLDASGSG